MKFLVLLIVFLSGYQPLNAQEDQAGERLGEPRQRLEIVIDPIDNNAADQERRMIVFPLKFRATAVARDAFVNSALKNTATLISGFEVLRCLAFINIVGHSIGSIIFRIKSKGPTNSILMFLLLESMGFIESKELQFFEDPFLSILYKSTLTSLCAGTIQALVNSTTPIRCTSEDNLQTMQTIKNFQKYLRSFTKHTTQFFLDIVNYPAYGFALANDAFQRWRRR